MTTFVLTTGTDNFTGTSGQNNIFQFHRTTLQATDHIAGVASGAFIDIMEFVGGTPGETIDAAQFGGVSNIERLIYSQPGTVFLSDTLVGGSSLPNNFFEVVGSSSGDTVDGSAVTLKRLNIDGGTGNVSDTLKGGALDDIIVGGPGADTMVGGGGNDDYTVDNVSDVVTEALGGGNDIVHSSVDYTLPANVDSVVLTGPAITAVGNADPNALIGNDNNNILNGMGGADHMVGGKGDDVYYVDNVGDEVVEAAGPGEGNDIVNSEVDYTLGPNVDSVVLVAGSAAISAMGNSLDNALVGNDNANNLDGGGGADFMVGGKGNDVYYVDNAGDRVIENAGAGEGNDIVNATFSYTLGENVESVVLVAGAGNIDAAGNNDDNALIGNEGNNALDGKGGADFMVGGDGNDLYFVENPGDTVVEDPSHGTDTVRASLNNYTLTANVENLILEAGVISGNGNTGANTITGNSSDNIITGGGGADVLNSGGGNDTIRIADSAFASIDGGTGLDRITLTAAGQTLDLTANASKIHNVEIISLSNSSAATLLLVASDIPLVNASGNYLYVLADTSGDQVSIGAGWTVMSTTHVNNAVAPGALFIHYHNSNGSDLYIQGDGSNPTPTVTGGIGTNAPPTVSLGGEPDGNNLPDGQDHAANYTTGNTSGVAIGDVDASITDQDTTDSANISAHIASLDAVLTDPQSGALEFLNVTAAGHTIITNNGLTLTGEGTANLHVSGNASDAVYQNLLREIHYVNSDQSPTLNTSARHVTVVVSDGIDNSNTATATISLSSGAPTANNFSIGVQEDINVGSFVNVLTASGASDPNGDTLTVSKINGSALNVGAPQTTAHGSFVVNTNGSASFIVDNGSLAVQQLAAGQTVQDTFTFTVTDGHGSEVTKTATVNVAGNNDAPAVGTTIGTQAATEDSAFNFAVPASAFSDIDTLDTLTLTTVGTVPAWLSFNGTSFTGTPVNADVGSYSITVKATDLSGASAQQTFTITVANTNDDPVANSDSTSTNEDAPVTFNVLNNDSDVDGNSLSVTDATVQGGASVGTATINPDKTITFTPAANYNGPAVIDYTISDSQGGTATSTLSISVNPVNDAPQIRHGALDIVTANTGSHDVSILSGDGTGAFTAQTASTGPGTSPVLVALGDLDGDGNLDIVTTDFASGGEVKVLMGDGAGGASLSASLPSGGVSPSAAAIGDVDFDGDLDIVVTNADSNDISVLTNDGAGNFTLGATVAVGGNRPQYIVLRDFNNDTILDAVTANFFSHDVSLLFGDGSGGFGPAIVQGLGVGDLNPNSLAVGDLNGDGYLDIATANYGSHSVSILFGDGIGNFAVNSVDLDVGNDVTGIAIGDINGDGKADIVAADYTGSNIFVMFGDGNGGFSASPIAMAGGVYANDLALGDVNNDGDLDIVVPNYGPTGNGTTATVLLGDGAGGFTISPVGIGAVGPLGIALGDVNSADDLDGAPGPQSTSEDTAIAFSVLAGKEIRIADIDGGSVSVDLSVDHGTLNAGAFGAAIVSGTGTTLSVSGTVADVNATLASLTYQPNSNFNGNDTLTIATSDGSLSDTDTVAITVRPVNDAPVAVFNSFSTSEDNAVTVNVLANDSDVENGTPTFVSQINGSPIAVNQTVNVTGGTVKLLANQTLTFTPTANFNGTASFNYTARDSVGAESAPANVLISVTAVNDAPVITTQSVIDYVVPNSGTSNITVLTSDGMGGFNATAHSSGGGVNTVNAAIGDFNNDGKLDIAAVNHDTSNVSVLLRNGLGGFDASTTGIASGQNPIDLVVGDVDRDGNLDIVTANRGPGVGGVSLLLGDGLGGFSASDLSIGAGTDPEGVTLGDLNGDGNVDIVSANSTSNTVSILLGDGAGNFVTSTTGLGGGTGPKSVAIGDIDHDGNADIVVANQGSDNISILLGDGLGGFTASTQAIAGGDGPSSVLLGDFNGDNKLDIAVPNFENSFVTILINDGAGNFTTSTTGLGGGLNPTGGAIGDVNRDGNLDIVTFHSTTSNSSVLLGDGNGNFTASTQPNAGNTVAYPGEIADIGALVEDGELVFSAANGRIITIADVDGAAGAETVIVAVEHGTLTLGSTAGLTVIGDGTDSVSVTGTLANINAGLDGLTYTPDANYNGDDELTITADDNGNTGSGGPKTTVYTLPLTVSSVNDSPMAVANTTSTNEDTSVTYNVLVNDSDVDGDSLSVTVATVQGGAAVGTATISPDKTITFTPAANYNGPAVIDYTISDGHGGTASSTLSVTVNAVNDAPVAVPDTTGISTNEDNPVTFNVITNDTDVDGTVVAVSRINGVALTTIGQTVAIGGPGSVTWNGGGSLTFTPNLNFNGTANFNYTAKDNLGLESVFPASVSITVNAVNDAPVANDNGSLTNPLALTEDTPQQINVLANDTDVDGPAGGLKVVQIDSTPVTPGVTGPVTVSHGTVTVLANSTLLFTPDANYNGTAQFTYIAQDAALANSAPATVFLNIAAVNDAPVNTAPASVTATEDLTFTFNGGNTISVADVDSNVTVTLSVDHGTLHAVGAGISGDNTSTLTIASASPATVSSVLATLTYKGDLNFNGNDTLTIVTSDGTLNDTDSVAITVNAANDEPSSPGNAVTTQEDSTYTFKVSDFPFVDADAGDSLKAVKIISLPGASVGTLQFNGVDIAANDVFLASQLTLGQLTFKPAHDFNGAGGFTYTVEDQSNVFSSASATMTLNVTAFNDAPEANLDSLAVFENGPSNIGNVLDNDTDVDTPHGNLQVTSFTVIVGGSGTAAAGGTITLANGATLSVASNGTVTLNQGTAYDYLGSGESAQILFSYEMTDQGSPAGDSGTGALITVNGVNAPPTLSLGSAADLFATASFTPVGVQIADAAATITDEENKISAITVQISSGVQAGAYSADGNSANDTGERAQLDSFGEFGLSLLAGTATFSSGLLTLSFATPVTPAQATQILKHIEYVNAIGDFSLAVALDDTRLVTVSVVDHNGASDQHSRFINVAADVIDGNSNGTFVGSRFADTINGAGGDDTLTGGEGNDSLIGGNNTAAGDTVDYAKELNAAEVSETGTHGVVVNLSGSSYDLDGVDSVYDPSHLVNNPTIGAGQATDTYGNTDTLNGIENLVGTVYDDVIVDEKTVSNNYTGGETSETDGDTVVFRGNLGGGGDHFRVSPPLPPTGGDDFTVQYVNSDGTVVYATDTLTDIEHLVFDNTTLDTTQPVWLLDGSGSLVGTFSNLESAVNASQNGYTVRMAAGTINLEDPATPGTHDGQVFVNTNITIEGAGEGLTTLAAVTSIAGANLDYTAAMITTNNVAVTFRDFTLDGNDRIGGDVDVATGIRYVGGSGLVENVTVTDIGADNAPQPRGTGISIEAGTQLTVTNGNFTEIERMGIAAFDDGSNLIVNGGSTFVGKTGIDESDVTVTGTVEYGIQVWDADAQISNTTFSNFDDIETDVPPTQSDESAGVLIGSFNTTPTTAVTLTDVTFNNNLNSITIGFHDQDQSSVTLDNVTSNSTVPNALGLLATGDVVVSGVPAELDGTGVTKAVKVKWTGGPGNNNIFGDDQNDELVGNGGNDNIQAGGGDDSITYAVGDGADTVDGGSNTAVGDTVTINGTANDETFNITGGSPTAGQIDIDIDDDSNAGGGATQAMTLTDIEELVVNTGDGGDTVNISGDFGGTTLHTSSITVTGGAGNDTVDASGMTSAHRVVAHGNGGNDTLTGGAGNDLLDGGANDDTLTGGAGADAMDGGAGDDVYIIANNSDHTGDTITDTGVGGNDVIRFTSTTSNLVLNGSTTGIEEARISDATGNTGGTAAINLNASALSYGLTLTGNDGDNVLTGTAFGDTLNGNGGNDTLVGGSGDDFIHGGAGNDTATFSDTYANSVVTWDGTTATVTSSEGFDTIDGVGKLTFAGGTTVYLVSPTSEYATLTQLFDGNAANGEVDDNDVVFLASGHYNAFDFTGGGYGFGGSSSGNDGITIRNSGVTIRGAGDAASGSGSTVLDFNAHFPQQSVIALSANADNFKIQDIRFTNDDPTTNYGIVTQAGDIDGVTINNVTYDGTNIGFHKGSETNLHHLTVTNTDFIASTYGIYFAVDGGSGVTNDNVLLDNLNFDTPSEAAVYGETLQNATISNIVVTNGSTLQDNGVVLDFWTAYAGTSFSNISFNNIAISNDAAHPMTLAGIRVATYEDAAASPTNLSFTDVTITSTGTPDPVGLRVNADDSELHFIPTGANPNGLTLTNVTTAIRFEGRDFGEAFDASLLPALGNYIIWGERYAEQNGTDHLTGGDDTLTGGAGNDYIAGNIGNDTVSGGLGDDTISYRAGDGVDTTHGGGGTNDTMRLGGRFAGDLSSNSIDDSINVVWNGSVITTVNGGSVDGVEHFTIDLLGQNTAGDTLDYTGTTQAVTVNLSGPQTATGFDTVAGVENVTGGSAGDTLTGGSGANTIIGGAGNDQIVGGGGDDALFGGPDSDSFFYNYDPVPVNGAGHDTVDGGSTGATDVDTQYVTASTGTETFNINPIASGAHAGYLGINIEPGVGGGSTVAATDANYEIATTEVEEIVITTNGGGDSVIISGDLGGTGVATSTVTVNGDAGNNTFDASGIAGGGSAPSGGGWSLFGGHYYRFVSTPASWHNADLLALADGAYLANVTSSAENAFIAGLAGGIAVWLGGSDEAAEGTWIWTRGPEAGQQFWSGGPGGSPVGGMYNNWVPGVQPDNAGNSTEQDFTAMFPGGQWDDYYSSGVNSYVEEHDPVGSTPVDVVFHGDAGNDTLIGGAGNDTLDGGADTDTLTGGAGNDVLSGGTGVDTITGGAGDDTLYGNANGQPGDTGDTAVFANGPSGYSVTFNGNGSVTVVDTNPGDSGGNEGTDTLWGVQNLNFGGTVIDLTKNVLVYDGSYAAGHLKASYDTIQDALAAGTTVNGDTLLLSATTFSGAIDVTKQVTILGANHGVAGNAIGRPAAESVITGGLTVSADNVTIDGVKVTGAPIDDYYFVGVLVVGANDTIKNSVVDADGATAPGFYQTVGIGTFPSESNAHIAYNLITGYDNGVYAVGGGTGTVDHNVFDGNGVGVWTEEGGLTISTNDFKNQSGHDISTAPTTTPYDFSTRVASDNTFDTPPPADAQQVAIYGGAGSAEITGTVFGDFIDGEYTAGPFTFHGGGGNDYLLGNSLGDTLDGGTGADKLDGAAGNDTLIGGSGDDNLIGGADIDTVDYSQETGLGGVIVDLDAGTATDTFGDHDTLSGIENVIGTAQVDSLTGDSSGNTLTGLGGNDTLNGGAGNDTLTGGAGDDIVNGGANDDTIVWNAGDGDDTITGGGQTDTLQVTASVSPVDLVAGTTSFTVTAGGSTATVSEVETAQITLAGVSGDLVTLDGDFDTTGLTTLTVTAAGGEAEVDARNLSGALSITFNGNNSSNGFWVNDTGVPTTHTFAGGGGSDTILYSDYLVDGVVVDLGTQTATGFASISSIENVVGGAGSDMLTGGLGNNQLDGGDEGDDTFIYNVTHTGGGAPVITSGQDIFFGRLNDVAGDTAVVNGTASTETYNVNPLSTTFGINIQVSGNATPLAGVNATIPNSEVRGSTIEKIEINTGGGGDSVIITGDLGGVGVSTSTVTVNGDAGNNNFNASGITGSGYTPVNVVLNGMGGDDTLTGGAGNDTIDGGANNDTITGNAGDDTLIGGTGNDSLSGGMGNDSIDGGGDFDTANYLQFVTDYTVGYTQNPTTGFVTGFTSITGNGIAAASGTDTLANIEQLRFQNGDGPGANDTLLNLNDTVQLFNTSGVLVGTFSGATAVQSAVNAASTGFTIRLKGGVTFNEDVTVNKDVTIEGANVGKDGADVTRVAESSIKSLSITTDGVTIDGVKVHGTSPYVLSSSFQVGVWIGIDVDNVLLTNSVLDGNNANNAWGMLQQGYDNGTGGHVTNVDVTHNKISNYGLAGGYQYYLGQPAGPGDLVNEVAYNTFVNNGFGQGGSGYNLQIADPTSSSVHDNHFVSTTGRAHIGITVEDVPEDLSGQIGTNTFDGSSTKIEIINYPPNVGQDITGTQHDDVFTAQILTDNYFTGNDTLRGGGGNDAINGGTGNDTLTGGTGSDTVNGGAGNDTVNYVAGDGTDTLLDGGAQTTADTLAIVGTAGSDTININVVGGVITKLASNGSGLPGSNNVTGFESATINLGQGGFDVIDFTGTTQDITADFNSGVVTGFSNSVGTGNNATGGSGNDTLTGESGVNVLRGGSGNDTIRGNLGNDQLFGDAGNDTFNYTSGDGSDTVDGGADTDTLDITGTTSSDTVAITAAGSSFTVGIGGATITASAVEQLVYHTNGGGDNVTVSGNLAAAGLLGVTVSNISGGGNDDTLDATGLTSATPITFNAGVGNDTFKFANVAANDTFNAAGDGGDTADYSAATGDLAITLSTGSGSASATSGQSIGTDTLIGVENATGGSGNDTIAGTSVVNVLDGGNGNDTLTGGDGADTLTGGLGTDTVNYAAEAGGNAVAVNLSSGSFGGGAPAAGHAFDTFGNDDTLSSIENVTASSATAGDIVGLDGSFADWSLTFTSNGASSFWTATGLGAYAGQVHEFRGVEQVAFQISDEVVHLVDDQSGGSDYASIQAAINAASDGDTILIAAGGYTENVEVGKQLTILGANHGVAGNGGRGAETIVNGGFHLTSGDVTIDGVEILNGRVDYGFQRAGVFIEGALANVTVENSIIDQTTTVHPESSQHGIITTYNADTNNLQVINNVIKNWNEGAYLNPGVHDSTFSGNVFSDNGNHIVIDDLDDLTITNNNFGSSDGSKIVPMVYDNPTDLEIELGLSGNTFANDGKFAITTIPLGPNGQTILGTSIGERITAAFSFNPNFDYIFDGRGGNDTLVGGGGNDAITGGTGDDTIDSGAGNDTINYAVGDGNDTVNGGTETTADTLNVSNAGGAAATITVATTGAGPDAPITIDLSTTLGTEITATEIENINITMGSLGDSVIVSGDFSNTQLSASTITVTGGLGNDTVNAGALTSAHNVVFTGGAGTDSFTGGAGNDTFIKTAGADAGDSFTGGSGSDTIDYSAITSAVTVDLTGGAGTDTLSGVENVTATGQADTITVSSDVNVVHAGAGDDIILVTAGANASGDTLDGGTGTNDRIRFTSTTGGDTLTLNANTTGVETAVISDAAGVTTGTTSLNLNASAVTGNISLTGNDGDNALTGNGSVNTIIGGGGADTIDAGGGSDTVNAGGGNDTVIGTADGVSDIYNGGSGTDTIDYSALTALDSISVNLQTGSASGTAIGSDNLSGSSFENVNSGGGDDSLFGNLADNTIHGGGGGDNIVGGGGNDQLFGDAGNDTLNGGVNDFAVTPAAANDVLWGGAGTDTFRFEGRFGDDAIGASGMADWTDNEDMVFVGYGATAPIVVDDGLGNVIITVDDGSVASSVTVYGASASQMQQQVSGLDLIIH